MVRSFLLPRVIVARDAGYYGRSLDQVESITVVAAVVV